MLKANDQKERITVTFPKTLLRESSQAAKALSVSRAKLIRDALNQYLAQWKRERIEQQLIAGCRAMAQENLKEAEEAIRIAGEILE